MRISQIHLVSNSVPLKWLQYAVYSCLILYFGRDIFIPISFALLISFVLYPFCAWLERKGMGRAIATIVSIAFVVLMGLTVAALLVYQFIGFLDEWPTIYLKVSMAIADFVQLMEVIGVSRETQQSLLSTISNQSGSSLIQIIHSTISTSAVSVILLVLIPVYVFLILFYRRHWMRVLERLFPTERTEHIHRMISLTIKTYYEFIKGMTIVYVAVGVLNSIGLLLLGVPYAILFGFIASILTFIPYVGIMVGSLLPISMAWITYDSIWYPIGIIGVFTLVQYLEANVIFPVAVSNRLNVNTMVMLVAIFAGGILWGMSGMILFVPFVGIAKLITDHNPKWKTLSMILGTGDEHNSN